MRWAALIALCWLILTHQGKPGRPSWAAWAAAAIILGACFRLWQWAFDVLAISTLS